MASEICEQIRVAERFTEETGQPAYRAFGAMAGWPTPQYAAWLERRLAEAKRDEFGERAELLPHKLPFERLR